MWMSQRTLNVCKATKPKSKMFKTKSEIYLIWINLRAMNGRDDNQSDEEMNKLRHFHKSI